MKKTSSKSAGRYFAPQPIAHAVAWAMMAGASPLWAGPAGEQVVAGQATVSRSGSNTLITQGTERAAINWQNFNIGATESVRFAQPSASSIALNRVLGQNPTEILGSLSANGQVFLLNPNGVLFGQGAQVNVGGLVASTLSLSNEDFMAGRYRFVKEGNAGEVRNAGEIIANGGYVALIGPQVRNEGTITATNGSVALAAGDQVTLNLNGNKLIGLAVGQGALNALADNKGLIKADGGQVILTAKAADQLIKSVVNNDGIIEAGTLNNVNGVIRLEADNVNLGSGSVLAANGARGGDITAQARDGTLLADGRIEAVGSETTGGTVKLLGHQVGLINAVSVDASGNTGGGTVLVGGDYQGKNAEVQNAWYTYASPGSRINVDAVSNGNGGKAVLWADNTTRFYGAISARGGATGGDGGFVEVSGKDTLVFKGSVDTRAPHGNTGMLLLDPANITISNGSGDSTADGDALTTSFSGAPSGVIGTVAAGDNPAGGTLTLFETELEGISSTTNISLAASATITISNLADNNLNLAQTAGRSVSFNSATFTMTAGDTITTVGGALNITTTGAATIGALSTGGGAIAVNVGAASTASGVISGAGSLTKSGAGTLTLSGANTYTGTTTVTAGTLALGANNVLSDSTSVVVNGGTFDIATRSDTVAGVQLVSGSITGTTGVLTSSSTYDLRSGTVSARLAGAAGLNKTTTGTVTLSGTGTNTYTGTTSVQAGVLVLAKATALGATTAGTSETTVTSGAAVQIQGGISVAELITLNGTGVANDGALRSTSGANTWTGAVALGAGGSRINTDAGTLVMSGAGNISGASQPLTVGGAGNTTISKIISAGAVTKDGAGTFILSGVNTYSGSTTVTAGTLQLGANNTLPDTTSVVVNGGTLSVNTRTDTVAGVQLVSGSITGTTGVLTSTSDYDLQSGTVTAALAGAVSLNKSTSGTVTLGGTTANSYTGATNINGGTLSVTGGLAIPNASAVNLANVSGAILNLAASETIGNLA